MPQVSKAKKFRKDRDEEYEPVQPQKSKPIKKDKDGRKNPYPTKNCNPKALRFFLKQLKAKLQSDSHYFKSSIVRKLTAVKVSEDRAKSGKKNNTMSNDQCIELFKYDKSHERVLESYVMGDGLRDDFKKAPFKYDNEKEACLEKVPSFRTAYETLFFPSGRGGCPYNGAPQH